VSNSEGQLNYSDPVTARTRQLPVDRMISKFYFDYGLRHYPSWSQQPDYRFALIESASAISEGLQLRLFDTEYAITTHRERGSKSNEERTSG